MHLTNEVERTVDLSVLPHLLGGVSIKKYEALGQCGDRGPRRITHHKGPQNSSKRREEVLSENRAGLAHGHKGWLHGAGMKDAVILAGVNGSLKFVECIGWSKAVGRQPLVVCVTCTSGWPITGSLWS